MRRLALLSLLCAAGCSSRGFDPTSRPPVDGQPCAAEAPTQPRTAPTFREDDAPSLPARPPPAISGGTLAVLRDGSVAAADPDRDALWLVANDKLTARRVDFQLGDEPGRVVEGPAGTVFVSLRRGKAVAQVDAVQGKVVARHAVCGAPRGLAWLETQGALAVACATGTLAKLAFDTSDAALPLRALSTSRPGNDLRDVVAVGDALYISTYRDAQLLLIDFDGEQKWIPLSTLDGASVRNVGWRLLRAPNGVVMTHQSASPTLLTQRNQMCVRDASQQPLVVEGDAQYAVPGGLVHGGFTVVNSSGSATEVPIATTDAIAPLPVDMALTAGGNWAMATLNAVLYGDQKGAVLATLFNAGEVTSVGWVGDSVVAFSREPAKLTWWTPAGDSRGLLRELTLPGAASVRSTGHELFYRRTTSGLSCASCHPEAGEDGLTWLLPEGPRRTPTLRGGLRGTAPFHWAGDLSTMGALLDEVMFGRMGGIAQSAARTEALVDWLDGMPAQPAPDGLDLDAVARGKTLFDSAQVGCGSCHAGVQGTNNATVDVGTGMALQVPRLRELAGRSPYFHDGRIPQLQDRFLPEAGGDRHGNVSALTAQERDDLVAYLRSF
jgi:mono/diheme cytochrome c family protein